MGTRRVRGGCGGANREGRHHRAADTRRRGVYDSAVRIRGILLDFYGTVVEEDDDVIRGICEEVARDGDHSAPEIGAMWGREFTLSTAAANVGGFRRQCDLAVSSLARVLARVGSDRDPVELCAPQFHYWRSPTLRTGSREFLENCQLPICVVSNIDREDLKAAIEHHQLRPLDLVTSEDIGVYKPAPKIFRAGLEVLGMEPNEVLHIGDSLTADVAGADSLGIRVAWVNRKKRWAPTSARIDYELTDLREILPALDRIT